MDINILKEVPLFRSVRVEDLEKIFSELRITEITFKKDDILALQDEVFNRLINILFGSVKTEMNDSSGKVVKVEDVYAPNPLAILFLFGKENRLLVQVAARENTTAMVVSQQSMLKSLGMNEVILKNYLDISANFASQLSEKLHFMSFQTI